MNTLKVIFGRVYKSLYHSTLRNFVSFFRDFNGGSSKKEDLQMVALKSEEKMMESVRGGDHF